MATDVDRRGSLVTAGFRRVKKTFVHLKKYPPLFLFLLAFLLFNDGVETVIAMAGAFGTNQFIALGVLIGLVLGGVQAASRSLMAALTPKEIHNEAFGFFSMSGKFASIFGPLLYGALVQGTGNPRWGILSVPPFLIGGLIVLLMVREPRAAKAA